MHGSQVGRHPVFSDKKLNWISPSNVFYVWLHTNREGVPCVDPALLCRVSRRVELEWFRELTGRQVIRVLGG